MGKKGNKKYNANRKKINAIIDRIDELKRDLNKARFECPHVDDDGDVTVEFLENNRVVCTQCGEEFSFNTIDKNTLQEAYNKIFDAVNQIKALTHDPEKDNTTILKLSKVTYEVKEICDLYDRITNKLAKGYNKNKHKKHKKNNNYDFGNYGKLDLRDRYR